MRMLRNPNSGLPIRLVFSLIDRMPIRRYLHTVGYGGTELANAVAIAATDHVSTLALIVVPEVY